MRSKDHAILGTTSLVLFLYLSLLAVPASAQVGETSITGTIADGTGAVLPGVTVTATFAAMNVVRTTVSGADGRYRFNNLPVGRWSFDFTLDGFDSTKLENFELNVGQSPTINITMQVAGVAETITVQAETPVIETTRSELSHTIQDIQVEELPLLGRNWLDLAVLAAGVKSDGGSADDAPTAGIGVGRQDKVLIDGSDVNNRSTHRTVDIKLSRESIAEFEIKTNQFDAQLGQSGTSVTQAVTKSGTDAFHGSGFYYRRDGDWAAADFFTGTKNSDFSNTQVGGTIGGPILEGKAFFFFSYEWQDTPQTCSSNTGIAGIDSQEVGCGDNRNLWFIRGDVTINENHRTAFRYNRTTRIQPFARTGGSTPPGGALDYDFSFNRFNWSLNSVFGGNVVNRFIYNYLDTNRLFGKVGDEIIGPSVSPKLTTAGPSHQFPSAILGGTRGGGFENPDYWSIRDDVSTFFEKGGDHNLKFGGYLERAQLQGFFLFQTNGVYFFDQDPANIQECCNSVNWTEWDTSQFPIPLRYSANLGQPEILTPQNVYSAYVQDDWTMNEKLTLNLGLRWDLETGSMFNDEPDLLLQEQFGNDLNNFQPRLGVAFDTGGNGKTVVRGGLGRFHSQAFLNIALFVQRSNRPQEINVTVTNDDMDPRFYEDPLGGRGFEDFAGQIGSIPFDVSIFAPGSVIPSLWSFTGGVAHQITPSMALEVDYIHQRTDDQYRSVDTNLFPNANGTGNLPVNDGFFPELGGHVTGVGRPDPRWAVVRSFVNEGTARYNALSVSLQKRFQNNYSLGFTYLLSKNQDNFNDVFDYPSNMFDLADEYGTSLHDQRHRMTANWVWVLPYEFVFSGLMYTASGIARPTVANGQDLFGIAPEQRGLSPRPTCGLDPQFDGACSVLGIADGTRVPRNAFRSDSVFRLDVRLGWRGYISEGVFVEPTLEVFNLFNRQNNDPRRFNTNLASGGFSAPGRSTNLPYLPRTLQLGVILRF